MKGYLNLLIYRFANFHERFGIIFQMIWIALCWLELIRRSGKLRLFKCVYIYIFCLEVILFVEVNEFTRIFTYTRKRRNFWERLDEFTIKFSRYRHIVMREGRKKWKRRGKIRLDVRRAGDRARISSFKGPYKYKLTWSRAWGGGRRETSLRITRGQNNLACNDVSKGTDDFMDSTKFS